MVSVAAVPAEAAPVLGGCIPTFVLWYTSVIFSGVIGDSSLSIGHAIFYWHCSMT
jgi:hypothetical protein